MRAALVLSAVFAVGCATWRDVEGPSPYETDGYRIEVQPRVRTGGLLGVQEIRGTVRNDTDQDADILIVLHLFDEAGARVGQAAAAVEDLRPGAARKFDALVLPWWVPDAREWAGVGGPAPCDEAEPEIEDEVLKYEVLPFSRVEPGYILATPITAPRD